ncbi:MAG TPA: phytoene desaturase family protein [Gemmatimonadales bacterium]|nr:phytoene desaturase family protein [Gemmatimonadales bacterium]
MTVIGAGIGGLAAAVRLAHRGYRVTVLERQHVPGGRAGVWRSEGFTFDTGPSLVLMTEVWEKFFRDVGERLEDHLDLIRVDPNYRVTFPDGSTLEMTSRVDRLLAEVERIEPGAGPRLLAYLAHTARLYREGLGFIGRGMHDLRAMVNGASLGMLAGTGALGDLRRLVRRYFKDERLQQAFSFQSLYLGLSPYDSLAIYSLLAYTEIGGGIYYPRGGMHQLAVALARLAQARGVTIRYGADVRRLERAYGRVTAVELAGGERLPADLVVANSDLPYTYDTLLGEPYPGIEEKRFSCSVVLLYLGVDRTYPHLEHHNFVVAPDMRAACAAMFEEHRMPERPPFYVVASTRTDPAGAPPGCENLFVLVLAPSQHPDPARRIDWAVEGPRVEARTLEQLEAWGLTDLRRHIVTRRLVTPDDYTADFGNLRGEAFGLAHNFTQIGWFRPHNRHRRLENLYFVGQSTHPGCGLPMVLISADVLAERMAAEAPAR